MGALVLAAHRAIAAALVIAAAGVLASVVAIAVIVPHFRPGTRRSSRRYHEVGGSPGGILKTARHAAVAPRVRSAFDGRGLHYLLLARVAARRSCRSRRRRSR